MSKKNRLPVTLDRLLESIDAGALRHVPVDPLKPGGAKQPKLRELLERSRELLSIDRAATSRPDGFSSSTPGNGSPGSGKGGGMTMPLPDDAGGTDHVPTSSTERAAFAEFDGAAGRHDPLARIAGEIETELRRMDTALMRIGQAVARWDRLRSTVDLENPPQCHVASVLYRLPFDEKWEPHRRTTFADVLPQPWKEERAVCRMVYDFTREHRRLPSRDEMSQYIERAAVRVRAS